jgi:hypothetical protein
MMEGESGKGERFRMEDMLNTKLVRCVLESGMWEREKERMKKRRNRMNVCKREKKEMVVRSKRKKKKMEVGGRGDNNDGSDSESGVYCDEGCIKNISMAENGLGSDGRGVDEKEGACRDLFLVLMCSVFIILLKRYFSFCSFFSGR